jgi:predicted dinucleotide-binding enzyme
MPNKKISIIGAGKIGLALATLWLRAGHTVFLSSRHPEKLKKTVNELGLNAEIKSVKEAAQRGDIIVLSVPYDAVDEVTSDIQIEVKNKIIIDTTNPFGFSPEGHVISTLGNNITAGSRMASLLPNSTIVRAFTHIMEELLVSRGTKYPGLFAVAIAGDVWLLNLLWRNWFVIRDFPLWILVHLQNRNRSIRVAYYSHSFLHLPI